MINLAMREIKGKYKRTIFGQLWSLMNPIALMLVYTFVFSFVFRIQPDPGAPSGLNAFPLWLLCGLLPWMFFSRALQTSTSSLVLNQGLIQKVYFARVVMPVSDILAVGYNWLFEMGVLLLALIVVGAQIWLTLPYIVLALILLFLFTAGVGLLMSILNVYFRDAEHLLAVALQLWMYLTPVIYPLSLVSQLSNSVGGVLGTSITLMDIYRFNPMVSFIELFRTTLYDVAAPSPTLVLTCTVWAVVAIVAGVVLFSRKDKFLAEVM
jgi:lipopolysaccharide transport system permease protein